MAFIVKNKPVDYAALETGTYPARLVGLAGVGEQTKSYEGKERLQDLIILMFEVIGLHRCHKDGTPYTTVVDGKETPEPQTVRMEITRSLAANSNLLKIMSKLVSVPNDPTELDIEQALNAPCLLSVEKKFSASGTEYNKVETVSQPIMGMTIDMPRTKPFVYDVEDHTDDGFNALPEWIQDIVKKSTQWIDAHTPSTPVQTTPPNLTVVGSQTINTQTGEVIAQQQPMMTGIAQKAPF